MEYLPLIKLFHWLLTPAIIYGLIVGTEKLFLYIHDTIKRRKRLKRKGIYKKRNGTKIWYKN